MMTVRKYYEDHLNNEHFKTLIKALLLLREYETSSDGKILDRFEMMIKKFHIQWNEVENLIDGYAMRPRELNNLLKGKESEKKVSG